MTPHYTNKFQYKYFFSISVYFDWIDILITHTFLRFFLFTKLLSIPQNSSKRPYLLVFQNKWIIMKTNFIKIFTLHMLFLIGGKYFEFLVSFHISGYSLWRVSSLAPGGHGNKYGTLLLHIILAWYDKDSAKQVRFIYIQLPLHI